MKTERSRWMYIARPHIRASIKISTHTAQRKAKELLLRPYWIALNVFRLRLHEDETKNDTLSTTWQLVSILKTSSSRSINQTTHNRSPGRTQKHKHQFHTLKACQSALDEFKTAKTLGQLSNH